MNVPRGDPRQMRESEPHPDEMERLKYPIGRFAAGADTSQEERDRMIDDIAALPDEVRAATHDLDAAQLDTPYRPDGWTVRQLVHHLADSHMHAYERFRIGLTEEGRPAIRLHSVPGWAELPDSLELDPTVSLDLLDALHRRWTFLLRSLSPADFARTLEHPVRGTVTLDATLQLYAWHGRHHLAHITRLRDRIGW